MSIIKYNDGKKYLLVFINDALIIKYYFQKSAIVLIDLLLLNNMADLGVHPAYVSVTSVKPNVHNQCTLLVPLSKQASY